VFGGGRPRGLVAPTGLNNEHTFLIVPATVAGLTAIYRHLRRKRAPLSGRSVRLKGCFKRLSQNVS
ncbi:MAG: hypothetical protein ACREIC_21370, partial [Limisphaerales bacterium]